MIVCGHCHIRPALINTGISKIPSKTREEFRCLGCYQVEQSMAGVADWRDNYRLAYAKAHNMSQRPDEAPVNLQNRCKRLIMEAGLKLGAKS